MHNGCIPSPYAICYAIYDYVYYICYEDGHLGMLLSLLLILPLYAQLEFFLLDWFFCFQNLYEVLSFLPLFSLPYLLTPSCIYFVYWVSPKILMDKYDSWYKLFSSRDILLKCCRWWWRYRWLAKWRCGNYMLPSGNDNSLRFWVYMWSQIWFFFFNWGQASACMCVCACF